MAEEETAGTEPQEPEEVEGHGISVQLFDADGRAVDVHCGAYYGDN
jgi:hypothetical protein